MAKRVRKKDKIQWSQKKLKRMLIITALLIIPPFVLWGITTAIRSNKTYFIGKVGNWSITRPLWRRTLNHTRIDLFLKTGNLNLNHKIISDFAWQRLLLLYAAKQKRIRVNDKELANYIESLPFFQDKSGNFSISRYRSILASCGFREKDFEETLRENLIINKLQDIIAQNISISDKEINQAWQKEKEKLQIKYKIIPITEFLDTVSISDKEIQDYYQKHKEEFIIPEQVKIAYVEILQKNIPKTERTKLKPGKVYPLETFAKKYKLSIKQTPFFSPKDVLLKLGLPSKLSQYIFSLKEGETSPLLSYDDKYIILKVISVKPKHIASLGEVKNRIVETLKYTKAEELATQQAKQLLNTQPIDLSQWQQSKEFSYYDYLPKLGPAKTIFDWVKGHCQIKPKTACGPIKISSNLLLIYILKHQPAPLNIPKSEKERLKQQLLETKRIEKFQQYIRELRLRTPIIDSLSESN